jgi:riboflavin synthase
MFTGIVEEVGRVTGIAQNRGKRRLTVSSARLVKEVRTGGSVAVSGVCLTAVDIQPESIGFDLAAETWKLTSFSRIREGAQVNLELPMRADAHFGGHIVQGHVDGTGRFVALEPISDGNDYWLRVQIPSELTRYVIHKGSLAIEGISLTVARIEGTNVTVAIIPHTVEMTNLKSLKAGDAVNLEVDMIAKYAEKMMRRESSPASITLEKLTSAGF